MASRDKLDRWQNLRTVRAPRGFWAQLTDQEMRTWRREDKRQYFLSHADDRRAFRNYVRDLCAVNATRRTQ